MSKDTVAAWDANADNNTDISGINIAENCPPSGINNALRAIMAQVKAFAGNVVFTGFGVTNDFLGAVTKRLGNASTIYDGAAVERALGYRTLPSTTTRTAAWTLALPDVACRVPITTGGVTIPTNATVAFAIDDLIVIHNIGTASQSITPASGVTLTLAATVSTGARAIAQNGLATLLKVDTDAWLIYGVGVG